MFKFITRTLFIKPISLLFLAVLILTSCDSSLRMEGNEKKAAAREKVNFGSEWQFHRTTESLSSWTPWEEVNIPHTAKIEPLVVNDQWQGKAVYKKNFAVKDLGDKKWFFYFEGVMQKAKVFINDSLTVIHKGGYLPFTVDATPYLMENSKNTIEVKVTNMDNVKIPPGKPLKSLDFNLFGGIYRNVYLIKTNPIYITNAVQAKKTNSGGILVHFDSITDARATGVVKTHIRNETGTKKQIVLKITFSDKNGRKEKFSTSETTIDPRGDISITKKISLEPPHLWSPSAPNLYQVEIVVLADGKLVDKKELNIGVRDIKLTGKGFFLNGKKIFLNGTNRHQEYPYVGYALSDEAQYRDAYKIKNAGFNLVRLSHYPHAEAFMDAADELGLVLINSIPGWQYFGGDEFVENSIQNIKDMVRRDRNHPSVIFWENSLNESGMTEEYMVRANKVLDAELPYDAVYSAGWIDHPAYDLFIPARQHASPPLYWSDYNKPNRPILIAEYGDWGYYAKNAGFNQSAFSNLKVSERSSRQLRTAGEKGLLQQALNFQESFNSNLKGAQTIGQANWLMFDYNRGYSNDLEASGISDIFRLPKFSYYFYKSQKAPFLGKFSKPMVFIANYWAPTSTTKVKVFSNTEKVALYLNGRLIDKIKPEINENSDELPFPPFIFDTKKFKPGTLKAIGYIDGEAVASHIVQTPEKPMKMVLSVDISGKYIATHTPDVVFVYAKIVDKNGTLVSFANNKVRFSLENTEHTELIGENPINAKAGIATILLRTESFSSPITIKAFSEELGNTTITLEVNKKTQAQ